MFLSSSVLATSTDLLPFYTVENIVTARYSYVSYVLIKYSSNRNWFTHTLLTKGKWPESIIIVKMCVVCLAFARWMTGHGPNRRLAKLDSSSRRIKRGTLVVRMLRSSIIAAQESEAALGFGGAFFRYTNRKDVERDILLRPSMMFSCFWGSHIHISATHLSNFLPAGLAAGIETETGRLAPTRLPYHLSQ
jgi:hypothetical protein